MVEILRIVSAFGIKGAVRAVLYTDNLDQYKKLYDQDRKEYDFRVLHRKGNTTVLSLGGITDRNDAEQLVNSSFFVKKTDMPALEENKFYIFDLIGKKIKVADTDKELQIIDVKNFGAGDLIELAEDNQESFFVPFTKENFPETGDSMVISEKAYGDFQN